MSINVEISESDTASISSPSESIHPLLHSVAPRPSPCSSDTDKRHSAAQGGFRAVAFVNGYMWAGRDRLGTSRYSKHTHKNTKADARVTHRQGQAEGQAERQAQKRVKRERDEKRMHGHMLPLVQQCSNRRYTCDELDKC